MRTLAIGDVHGCAAALLNLLKFVDPGPKDTIVTLGDYIDRGPDSKGVLDLMIRMNLSDRLVPLRGNHEMMMLMGRESRDERRMWLSCGGAEALESYGRPGRAGRLEDIPEHHWHFVRKVCSDYAETDTHIFVHANLQPNTPLTEMSQTWLHWEFLTPSKHFPHFSGKTMICGHSEQRSGIPLVLDHAVCIDTWCYGGGWLTCLDVDSGEYWQADIDGRTRRGQLPPYEGSVEE